MVTSYPVPLLTVTEVAAWLRVKESTIRKMVCFNRIPYLKIGTRVLFRRSDIENWLRETNPQLQTWTAPQGPLPL